MDGWMEVLLICHISFCHFLREFLYNAIRNPQLRVHEKNDGHSRILEYAHGFWEMAQFSAWICMILSDTHARRTCPNSYLSVTSEMLSYVRPSRRARHPNGMVAFTWKKTKKQQTKTHIWGKAKTTLLDNRHMMKGLLSSMASMLKRKRGTDETLWKPSVVEVKHHGSATTESFRKILTIPDRHNWVNFSKNVCFNAPGFLVACQACQQTLSYPLSFYLLC